MDINDMQIFSEGHLPIVSGVYDQLKISKKIDEVVKWDEEKLIGENINYTDINEFAMGRNLDKIYDAYAKSVF